MQPLAEGLSALRCDLFVCLPGAPFGGDLCASRALSCCCVRWTRGLAVLLRHLPNRPYVYGQTGHVSVLGAHVGAVRAATVEAADV